MRIGLTKITPSVTAGAAALTIVAATIVATGVEPALQPCVTSNNSTNCHTERDVVRPITKGLGNKDKTAGDVQINDFTPGLPADLSGYVLGLQLSS